MYTEQQLIRIAKYAILHGYEKTEKVFFVSKVTIAKAVRLLDEIEPQFKIERDNFMDMKSMYPVKYKRREKNEK